MGSEVLWAYELGYREQSTKQFAWDIATFYNSYSNLVSYVPIGPIQPADPVIIPFVVKNGPTGQTYGAELTGNYSVTERWRLYAQYTVFQMHIYITEPGAGSPTGNDPCNQIFLRSAWDLRDDLEFDMMARYIDSIAPLNVPSYITMDLRLAWRPRKHWEAAIVAQNLLQPHHWEFGGNTTFQSNTYATEVPRGVYGTITWRR
jgi:iron complex outermembrane receptor protein